MSTPITNNLVPSVLPQVIFNGVVDDTRNPEDMKSTIEKILRELKKEGHKLGDIKIEILKFPNGIQYAELYGPFIGSRTLDLLRQKLWNKGQDGISCVYKVNKYQPS